MHVCVKKKKKLVKEEKTGIIAETGFGGGLKNSLLCLINLKYFRMPVEKKSMHHNRKKKTKQK